MATTRVWFNVFDSDGGVTGVASSTRLQVLNDSGSQYDFNDSTFKAPASCTTRYVNFSEFNSTLHAGRYYYDLTLSVAFVDGNYTLVNTYVGDFTIENQIPLSVVNGVEVNDLMAKSTVELPSNVSVTGPLLSKLTWLFQHFKLKKTVTATVETMYKNDGSTPLGTAALSDDGTTFTKDANT